MNKFQDRLNEAIGNRNISKAELARRTGIGRNSISDYTTGKYEAKQDNLYSLAEALDVNEAWLMGMDVPMERQAPTTLETFYNITDIHKEALNIVDSFETKEDIEKWFSNGYNLITESRRKKQGDMSQSTMDLINTLLKSDDVAIKGIAESSLRRYKQVNKLSAKYRGLLEDALLILDSDRTNTTEFINLKRKIYEASLPLHYIVLAYEKGSRTVKDLSDRYQLSEEFVVDTIAYYVMSKGLVIDYDGYLIDFNDIPYVYSDSEDTASAEFVVTDTNETRKSAKRAENKKGLFRK